MYSFCLIIEYTDGFALFGSSHCSNMFENLTVIVKHIVNGLEHFSSKIENDLQANFEAFMASGKKNI